MYHTWILLDTIPLYWRVVGSLSKLDLFLSGELRWSMSLGWTPLSSGCTRLFKTAVSMRCKKLLFQTFPILEGENPIIEFHHLKITLTSAGWPLVGNEGMKPYMLMMGIHSLIPYKGPASQENIQSLSFEIHATKIQRFDHHGLFRFLFFQQVPPLHDKRWPSPMTLEDLLPVETPIRRDVSSMDDTLW